MLLASFRQWTADFWERKENGAALAIKVSCFVSMIFLRCFAWIGVVLELSSKSKRDHLKKEGGRQDFAATPN